MNIFSKKDIVNILKTNEINETLFREADNTRIKYLGNSVHLRGLIEFSNFCKMNCQYCGLRFENKSVNRYRMTKDEISDVTDKAVKAGYKTIVLQSGEDSFFTIDKMCEIISEIKKFDLALTLSLGEKTFEEYKAYKDAGADRYLLKIETTDENLYTQMHPNASFKNRLKCLENLKSIGYEVGTGCLVGLPNQSLDSLANDILFFKKIDADMVGIGPFIPHSQTPLKNENSGNFELSLKVMAITRILLQNINIPATTAMETLVQNGRFIALQSGANVIMPNITPYKFCKNYEIYPNKYDAKENLLTYRQNLIQQLSDIGRTVSTTQGFRQKSI